MARRAPWWIGLALVTLGAGALAVAAWLFSSATVPGDAAAAEDIAIAVAAFQDRVRVAERVHAVGLALIPIGLGAAMVLAGPRDAGPGGRLRAAGWALAGAGLLLFVARWRSLLVPTYSESWRSWVGLEAVAWAAIVVALLVAGLAWRARLVAAAPHTRTEDTG